MLARQSLRSVKHLRPLLNVNNFSHIQNKCININLSSGKKTPFGFSSRWLSTAAVSVESQPPIDRTTLGGEQPPVETSAETRERILRLRAESAPGSLTIGDFNQVITALGYDGKLDKALGLFDLATNVGVKPDEGTYTGLIVAFGVSGDVENALESFKQLREEIEPTALSILPLVKVLLKSEEPEKALDVLRDHPYPQTPLVAYLEFAKLQPLPEELRDGITGLLLENPLTREFVPEFRAKVIGALLSAGRMSEAWEDYESLRRAGLGAAEVAEQFFDHASPTTAEWERYLFLLQDVKYLTPKISQGLIHIDPAKALEYFLSLEPSRLSLLAFEHIIVSTIKADDIQKAALYLQILHDNSLVYTPKICNALLEYHGERKNYKELLEFLDMVSSNPEIGNPRTYRLLIKYCLRGNYVAEAVRSFQELIARFPNEAKLADFQQMILICSRHQLSAVTLSLTRDMRKRFPKSTFRPTSNPNL